MCGTQSISLRGTRGLATTLSTRAQRAVSRVVYRLFLPRAVGAISRQPGRSLPASALLFTPMHPSAYKKDSRSFAVKGFCELRLNGVLTAGCIDTDPPVSRGDFGQSHKAHIEIAHVHHAVWVTFSETRCEKFEACMVL